MVELSVLIQQMNGELTNVTKIQICGNRTTQNPTARVIIVLGAILIAAVVGGAPSDPGF
ncbi:MAG: hypothetical protein GY796_12160 [Chloroflexi bacterium]|nr:hypothetical protein [Chloroflexota bacterium]